MNTKPISKITVILGGARSGKSRYAVESAKKWNLPVVFIATCVPADAEMRDRVARHQKERPAAWQTLECAGDPAVQLRRLEDTPKGVLIDCLTLYISGLLMQGLDESEICRRVEDLCDAARETRSPVILVSNEVGQGVVPENDLARRFRDAAGRANQIAARGADEVYWMVAGIPNRIK